jgi:membrane protein DedA with SNARE-associated domain
MAHLSPDTIAKLQAGGYVVMFGLMVIEGPIITLMASFLASIGLFSFPLVLLLGWMGDITGDLMYFAIGRFGLKMSQKIQQKDQ